MSNLGYFQLKATPNIWSIRLGEGQSQDIYEILGFFRKKLILIF